MFGFKDWNDALVGDKPHDAFVQYAICRPQWSISSMPDCSARVCVTMLNFVV